MNQESKVGGAEPNRQKNESPLISIKFGGIVGSVCECVPKNSWRKILTRKVLLAKKTLKRGVFGQSFSVVFLVH